MEAAKNGHLACVKALLRNPRVDPLAAREFDGVTALILAAQNDHADCVKALWSRSDPGYIEFQGELSAARHAALHGSLKTLRAMDKLGENMSQIDDFGSSLLATAATGDSMECINFLLKFCGPDHQDFSGQTPIFSAVVCSSRTAFDLLKPISDLDHKDSEGKDLIAVAREQRKHADPAELQVLESIIDELTSRKKALGLRSQLDVVAKAGTPARHDAPPKTTKRL